MKWQKYSTTVIVCSGLHIIKPTVNGSGCMMHKIDKLAAASVSRIFSGFSARLECH
jgi:hypothetical protein